MSEDPNGRQSGRVREGGAGADGTGRRNGTGMLPGRLSELLRTAIRCARGLDRERYTPDWTALHVREADGTCRVCLAGAVAGGRTDAGAESVGTRWEGKTGDQSALHAVDLAREGEWIAAFEAAWDHAMLLEQLRQGPHPVEHLAGEVAATARAWMVEAAKIGLEGRWSEAERQLDDLPLLKNSRFRSFSGLESLCAELEAVIPDVEAIERYVFGNANGSRTPAEPA